MSEESLSRMSPIKVKRGGETRSVFVTDDLSIPLSDQWYVMYDDSTRVLRTTRYYAEFAKDRFHFLRAGVKDTRTGKYFDLTNELKIEIVLRALWGLVPIRYNEDNMVCYVKRYKKGPIRLIRRGDFHLSLGLGVKGSRAAVNQICYSQMVKVPVFIHAPVRFGAFFKDLYIEMTPVVRDVKGFKFRVPGTTLALSGTAKLDTTIDKMPNNEFMSVSDGSRGYGWVLQAKIAESYIDGSSFVFRRPSTRNGYAECGYRLLFQDLQKGYYEITNWVLFQSSQNEVFQKDYEAVLKPSMVNTRSGDFINKLSATTGQKK
jgi:hypothetical protein